MTPSSTLVILGMGLVTLLPRVLPAVIIDRMHFGPRVKKFLGLIPYTAMAAMIFPGVLWVDPARPEIGLLGGGVALLLAWRKCPVLLCVIAAILTDMLLYTVL